MGKRELVALPTGDKWQSKTLFLAHFGPRSSIVKSIFDCRLPGVEKANDTGRQSVLMNFGRWKECVFVITSQFD